MVSKKTGALMECSFYLGALLGTDVPDAVESFKHCGRNLGLVFQIRDDILGVWGTEENTGKPIAADIKRKKKCLPVVYALQEANGSNAERLRAFFKKGAPDKEAVKEILGILDRLDTLNYCQFLARDYCDRALQDVQGAKLSLSVRSELEELANFFLEREH
ncbi:MAG: polyprenyl synthetase family protein, partial [Dehalococcoidia bacterium]